MIDRRLRERIDDAQFDRLCAHAQGLEKLLVADGALVLKFWIHLPKKELARRVRKADQRKGRRAWQIEDADRRILEHYDAALPWLRRFLRLTDWSEAPWTMVEGSDDRHRNLLVARMLLERLGKHLAARAAAPPRARQAERSSAAAAAREPGNPRPRRSRKEASLRRVPRAARQATGTAPPARRPRAREGDHQRAGLRGLGRRRQGRRDPPHHAARSTPATTTWFRSPRRPTRRRRTTISGASGGACREPARW